MSSSDKFWFSGNVTGAVITILNGAKNPVQSHIRSSVTLTGTKKLQFYAIVILATRLNYDPQFKHVILRRIYGAPPRGYGVDMGPNVASSSSLAQLRN